MNVKKFIKNRTCCYFNDIIELEDSDKILVGEKS